MPWPGTPQPAPWWRQECPERGGGLTHAHWSKCDPSGVHPQDDTGNEGNQHPAAMCCHCQMTEQSEREMREADIAMREAGVPRSELADHEYVFTIVGRCGRCQRTPDIHPKYRRGEAAEEGGCVVDHSSITTKLLIGDGGLQWSQCPQCQMYLEPKAITGNGPQGRPTDRGRGTLTERHKADLVKAAQREDFSDWLRAGRPDIRAWLQRAKEAFRGA